MKKKSMSQAFMNSDKYFNKRCEDFNQQVEVQISQLRKKGLDVKELWITQGEDKIKRWCNLIDRDPGESEPYYMCKIKTDIAGLYRLCTFFYITHNNRGSIFTQSSSEDLPHDLSYPFKPVNAQLSIGESPIEPVNAQLHSDESPVYYDRCVNFMKTYIDEKSIPYEAFQDIESFSGYITGFKVPTLHDASKIARVLQVPLVKLLEVIRQAITEEAYYDYTNKCNAFLESVGDEPTPDKDKEKFMQALYMKSYSTYLIIQCYLNNPVTIAHVMDIELDDIDFDKSTIHFKDNDRQRRPNVTLPIDKEYMEDLDRYIKSTAAIRVTQDVFIELDGKKMKRERVNTIFNNVTRTLAIDPIIPLQLKSLKQDSKLDDTPLF